MSSAQSFYTSNINSTALLSNAFERNEKLKEALKSIWRIKSVKELLEDDSAFESLFYVQRTIQHESFLQEENEWLFNYNLDKLFASIWNHLLNEFDKLNFRLKVFSDIFDPAADLNHRILALFDYIILITRELTNNQFQNDLLFRFNKSLFEKGLLICILSILEKFHRLEIKDGDSFQFDVVDVIHGLFLILLSLSENPFYPRNVWIDANAKDILDKFKFDDEILYDTINRIYYNLTKKTLPECLNHLRTIRDAPHIIESNECYTDLLNIFQVVSKRAFNKYELFMKYQSDRVFTDVLSTIYNMFDRLEFQDTQVEYTYPRDAVEWNERVISILHYILLIINKLVFKSIKLSVYYANYDLIQTLLLFLIDNRILNKLIDDSNHILSTILSNLVIMSKHSDKNPNLWIQLNAVDFLNEFVDKFKDLEDLQERFQVIDRSYSCILNLTSQEPAIMSLKYLDLFMNRLLNSLNLFAHVFENGKLLQRVEIEFLDERENILTIRVAYLNGKTLTGILQLLNRLAHSSATRKRIYQEKRNLKTIILMGNFIERIFALKLLKTLTKDESIQEELAEDEVLMRFFHQTIKEESNKELKNICHHFVLLNNRKLIQPVVMRTSL